MTSEFYEQLGVDRAASAARIRSAYATALARLAKRRRALVDQGGDTLQIDLQRARLDEAWDVLSDPVRRRRYDVMLTWTEGDRPRTVDGLWDEVSDALVHPAAAVAAKLLRVTSRLTEIGTLPLAPSGAADEPPTLVPHDDDLTMPRAARLGSGVRSVPGEATSLSEVARMARQPVPPLVAPGSVAGGDDDAEPEVGVALRLGDEPEPTAALLQAMEAPPPALVTLPPVAPERPQRPVIRALPAEDVVKLVEEFGYTGMLLKVVRERLGLRISDIADHTRISVRYLDALEAEDPESLPAATFVRGYVREVARMLHLDPEAMVGEIMTRLSRQGG